MKDALQRGLRRATHGSACSRMWGSSLSGCHSRLTRASQNKEHASTLLLFPPCMHSLTPFLTLSTKDSSSAALLLLAGCSKKGQENMCQSCGTVGVVGIQGVTSLDSAPCLCNCEHHSHYPQPVNNTAKKALKVTLQSKQHGSFMHSFFYLFLILKAKITNFIFFHFRKLK